MSRPKKCRKICALPRHRSFGPLEQAKEPARTVIMSLDEYEAIRLIDLLGCTQEECAVQMDVARTTVQAVYNRGRQKLAELLVNGGKLISQGGDYTLCPDAAQCCGKNCSTRRCGKRCCQKGSPVNGGCQDENCSHL